MGCGGSKTVDLAKDDKKDKKEVDVKKVPNKPVENKHPEDDKLEGINLILVGDSQCGKSSILKRYLHNTFDDEYVGTSDFTEETEVVSVDGKSVVVTFVDTPGMDREIHAVADRMKKCQVVIFVYDLTDKDNFYHVQKLIEDLDHLKDKQIWGMLGTKEELDKSLRKYKAGQVESYCESKNILHEAISCMKKGSSEVKDFFDKKIFAAVLKKWQFK